MARTKRAWQSLQLKATAGSIAALVLLPALALVLAPRPRAQGLERLLPVRQLKHFQAQAVAIIGVNAEVSALLQGGDHTEYFTDRAAHRPGQGIQAHGLFGIGQHFQDVQACVQGRCSVFWRFGGSTHRDKSNHL